MVYKDFLKKTWNFIWNDDSFASFIVNIILAFIIIKFIVFPVMGVIFGTNLPLVAVVSGSMHHEGNFDEWWSNANDWYVKNSITESNFREFSLINGFNKGDIMLIIGATNENVQIGDIIVFEAGRDNPIIHRVVNIYNENGNIYYRTKGDNYVTNPVPIQTSLMDETRISIDKIEGKALIRIPYLGYIKLLAINLIAMVN